MNRKDTILVAVLVNVGVLLILFVSALRPHAHLEWQAANAEQGSENAFKAPIARVESKKENDKEDIPKEFSQAIEQLFKTEDAQPLAETKTPVEKKLVDPSLLAVEVKSGDVLEKISKTNGVSVEDLKKINQLQDDKLQIGQVLYVPQSTQKQTAAAPSNALQKATLSDDRYYTVKNGDNPWTIASKNHIKVEDLLRLNSLDEAKAKKIKPGDRLRIK